MHNIKVPARGQTGMCLHIHYNMLAKWVNILLVSMKSLRNVLNDKNPFKNWQISRSWSLNIQYDQGKVIYNTA